MDFKVDLNFITSETFKQMQMALFCESIPAKNAVVIQFHLRQKIKH
jgi:hypothetical protein